MNVGSGRSPRSPSFVMNSPELWSSHGWHKMPALPFAKSSSFLIPCSFLHCHRAQLEYVIIRGSEASSHTKGQLKLGPGDTRERKQPPLGPGSWAVRAGLFLVRVYLLIPCTSLPPTSQQHGYMWASSPGSVLLASLLLLVLLTI